MLVKAAASCADTGQKITTVILTSRVNVSHLKSPVTSSVNISKQKNKLPSLRILQQIQKYYIF